MYSDVCILVCGHLLRPLVSEAQQRRRSEDRLRFIWRQSHAGHPLGLFSCGQKSVVLHTLLLSSCRTQECVKHSAADLQTHAGTHAHLHMHARTHTRIHTHTHTHTITHTRTHTYTHARIHTHTHTLTYLLTRTHAHTNSHTHAHTLIHTHTHTETHTRCLSHTNPHTHTQSRGEDLSKHQKSLSTARSHLLKVQFTLKCKYSSLTPSHVLLKLYEFHSSVEHKTRPSEECLKRTS